MRVCVCFLFDVSFGGIKTSGVSHLTRPSVKNRTGSSCYLVPNLLRILMTSQFHVSSRIVELHHYDRDSNGMESHAYSEGNLISNPDRI